MIEMLIIRLIFLISPITILNQPGSFHGNDRANHVLNLFVLGD